MQNVQGRWGTFEMWTNDWLDASLGWSAQAATVHIWPHNCIPYLSDNFISERRVKSWIWKQAWRKKTLISVSIDEGSWFGWTDQHPLVPEKNSLGHFFEVFRCDRRKISYWLRSLDEFLLLCSDKSLMSLCSKSLKLFFIQIMVGLHDTALCGFCIIKYVCVCGFPVITWVCFSFLSVLIWYLWLVPPLRRLVSWLLINSPVRKAFQQITKTNTAAYWINQSTFVVRYKSLC